MTDTDLTVQRLMEAEPIRKPVLRSIIQSLQLPPGSQGLDVGCGIGLQSLLLAEAVGHTGRITGLDINPELIKIGENLVKTAGLSDRISFREGDMSRLPFPENNFDWAWSADCIGYPIADLKPILEELIRVVRPGGSVILLGWSSQQVLPGYPLLEARLNATCSGYIPFLTGKSPELHFQRALHSFHRVGLKDCKAQTFAGDVQAPLGKDERAALSSLFEMLWGKREPDISQEDWNEFQRLCLPGSADFILNIPDYYGFFTYSMFWGKVPLKMKSDHQNAGIFTNLFPDRFVYKRSVNTPK